jgi:hypothetical protein
MIAIAAATLLLLACAAGMMLLARRGVHDDSLDAGTLSARWLSDIRRDDPWPGR